MSNRNYEYIPEYKTFIQKAPAFQTKSKHAINKIVERLNTPKAMPNKDKEQQGTKRPPTARPKTFSALSLNQPTVSSYIRFLMSARKAQEFTAESIKNACEKDKRHPAKGHLPAKFRNWFIVEGKRLDKQFII